MLAQLIQALYNIVDSLFVGKYSESGLTAYTGSVGIVCTDMLPFYARICVYVYGFRGSHKGCDRIRPDRLRIQHRTVYRKYLDKDFTGKWGHEDTDDRTDRGGTG